MRITLTFTIDNRRWPGTRYIIRETIENILRLANAENWKWEYEEI